MTLKQNEALNPTCDYAVMSLKLRVYLLTKSK